MKNIPRHFLSYDLGMRYKLSFNSVSAVKYTDWDSMELSHRVTKVFYKTKRDKTDVSKNTLNKIFANIDRHEHINLLGLQ